MMISNLLDISFFSGRSRADAAGLSVAEDYVSDTYIVVRDSPCFLKLVICLSSYARQALRSRRFFIVSFISCPPFEI